MRPFRFSFHPVLLAVIGVASGALALGASTLGPHPENQVSAPSPPRGSGPAGEATLALYPAPRGGGRIDSYSIGRRSRWFPALFSPEEWLDARPRGFDLVASSANGAAAADRASLIPALANNLILAFYGKPDSRRMGILGEYPKEELAEILEGYAKLYGAQNGSEGVVPAFYLIYGTCWPGGEIGYLKDSVVLDYIDFARQRGWLVFVDHQIGKYPVADAMTKLLPWLKYPNVHIALDPEWRTESPMKVIGGVSADEINAAEETMSDYMGAEGIPGVKMLIVHQFQGRMIAEREKVRADYDGVLLIHTADGFGPPALKRWSYSSNAKAANMPLKGFKLFFKTDIEGAGYDDPLLLPAEVLALDPAPRLIIYQ
jgi:hypothetical protein